MAISFPQATTVGETYTDGTSTWVYNGTGWEYLDPSKNYFQADAPAVATNGQNWTSTTTGRLYTYLQGQWINEGAVFKSASTETQKAVAKNAWGVNPIGYPMTWRESTTIQLKHSKENPNVYGSAAADQFGYTVSISDSYFITGAWGEDEAGGSNSGKAYIYSASTGNLLHTLSNPSTISGFSSTVTENDYFGYSVDICESYSVVGVLGENQMDGALTRNLSGIAYIYNNSTGALLHTLTNPSPETNARFGAAVGITESYTIVGAFGANLGSGVQSGRTYIFSTATGALLHTLDNPNPDGSASVDRFGDRVDICESYAIVGTPYEGSTESGKAYIFNPATGALLHTLDNPNPFGTVDQDNFGWSVSICESYAIVGAYGEDDGSGNPGGGTGLTSGKAYIFNPATGALLHTLDNPNAVTTTANDSFGKSVGITESYAIVGADNEMEDAYSSGSGKAYVFDPATGTLIDTLDNPNIQGTAKSDKFAQSVAICESYALAGALEESSGGDNQSGAVYVFEFKIVSGVDSFYSAISSDNMASLVVEDTMEQTFPFVGYSTGSDDTTTTLARLMRVRLNQLGAVNIGASQNIPRTITTSWDLDTNQFVSENGSTTVPNLRAGISYYGILLYARSFPTPSSVYPCWAIMGMNPDTNEVQLPGFPGYAGQYESIAPANARMFFIGVADDEEHISLLSNPDTIIQPTHIGTNPAGFNAEWLGSASPGALPPAEAMSKPWVTV